MKSITKQLSAALIAAFISVSAGAAETKKLIVGVNRVNIAWQSPADIERIISDMARNKVTSVRLSLSPPIERSIYAVELARAAGINVLLEIPLGNSDLYLDKKALSPGYGRIWDMRRLSDIDVKSYRRVIEAAISSLDALGLDVQAIEVGNEINWAPYNGDLTVYERENVATAQNISSLQKRDSFLSGMKNYAELIRATKKTIAGSRCCREAVLVSAGLSDVTKAISDRRGFESVSVAEMFSLFKELGLDELVDVYGIHTYPNKALAPDVRERHFMQFFEACKMASKRCWVTEWGVPGERDSCELTRSKRSEITAHVRGLLEKLHQQGVVQAIYAYDWDSKGPLSLWRCSRLTPSGIEALKE